MERDLILVGKIIKPHSIRGGVTVETYCDDPGVFKKGKRLIGLKGKDRRDFLISSVGKKRGRVILNFKEVEDRNDAEKLRNFSLFVYRNELSNTEEGEYYFCDLLDCEVKDEENRVFGKVVAIFENNNYPILRIRENKENREIELPFVSKFIKSVNPNKYIVVDGDLIYQLMEINYPE